MTKLATIIIAAVAFSGAATTATAAHALPPQVTSVCTRMIGAGYRGFVATPCATHTSPVSHHAHLW